MKLVVFILCGLLWELGGSARELPPFAGHDKKEFRVIGIPSLISFLFLLAHPILSFYNFFTMQVIRIGYGVPDAQDTGSFLGKIFKEAWVTRAVAGFLYGAVGGLGLLFGSHNYQAYVAYIIINTAVNGSLTYLKADKMICEVGAGLGIGTIIWLM